MEHLRSSSVANEVSGRMSVSEVRNSGSELTGAKICGFSLLGFGFLWGFPLFLDARNMVHARIIL